jgi:flagellar biosynthesis/type III secretory pathway chaperone
VNLTATSATTAIDATPVASVQPDWEGELTALLDDLSSVQDELFQVLAAKRERLAQADAPGMEELQLREEEVCQRLEQCHERRRQLLAQADRCGLPNDSMAVLAANVGGQTNDKLGKQVKQVASNMRLLQNQSLTNWVLAQRALLHVSQLLEIIATGGRMQPTYGDKDSLHSRGSLVDHEI